jgi:D-tyrosyl-tRNA(Tyr) deacylase
VQRVSRAEVVVDAGHAGAAAAQSGQIGRGLLVLACAMEGDDAGDVAWLAEKLAALRVFPNDAGRLDLCLGQLPQAERGVLVVSQFTLSADLGPGISKGNRPAFTRAMAPERAVALVDALIAQVKEKLPGATVASGTFGAHMRVSLENDGPLTLWVDTRAKAPAGRSHGLS